MNPMSTIQMLLGTCTDRFLTRIDPNAKDENVSWTMFAREGNWPDWPASNGDPAERLIVYPEGISRIGFNNNVTPNPLFGVRMPNQGYLAGPVKTSGKTSELYLRAIVFMEPSSGRHNILSMTNAAGEVILGLDGSAANQNGWSISCHYRDTKNVERNMQVYQVSMPEPRWLDVKVFIPASGTAEVTVTPITQAGGLAATLRGASPGRDGFMDGPGDRFHAFTSSGPFFQYDPQLHMNRLGVGNKISTARP